ncbi:MAG: nitronate monooxygenase [Ectothiorhodospiraceae bacterium]|nr:nitronate monooxygenase [Ectothiorhodospiraceae bacterium]MCH8503450.1 nitronate monooxygenase [Ectothiorhodospiraceae bacterium]
MGLSPTPICDRLGVRYPIFGFSHSVDVVAEIARAGGFGVLGIAREMPEDIPDMLSRVEDALDGKPYGIDLMLPKNVPKAATLDSMRATIPREHQTFVDGLVDRYQLPEPSAPSFFTTQVRSEELLQEQSEHILRSNAAAVATAIGIRPDLIARAKAAGKLTISLVGSVRHARKVLDMGVEVLVAQGYDAGGHTGPIGTFSLVPQIVAVAGDRPVLAAGGIATGGQVVASLAMGAQGAWLGTLWLAARENHTPAALLRRLIDGDSEATIITRAHSGKPCRVIRSEWIDAWQAPGAPEPLGMPLQQALTGDAFVAMHESDDPRLIYEAAGQSVFGIRGETTVADQMATLVEESERAMRQLSRLD